MDNKLESAWREYLTADMLVRELPFGNFSTAPHIALAWTLILREQAAQTGCTNESGKEDFAGIRGLLPTLAEEELHELSREFEILRQAEVSLTPAPLMDEKRIFKHIYFIKKAIEALEENINPRQKLQVKTKWRICFVLLAVFILAYLAVSWWRGSLDPRLWMARRYHQFLILSSRQDWGQLGVDLSVEGNGLQISSQKFSKGLGTHANSTIVLRPPPGSRKFSGGCGIDTEAKGSGSVKCLVKQDNKILFQSEILRGNTPPALFNVEIDSSMDLTLEVDGVDSIGSDHTDWVDLKAES